MKKMMFCLKLGIFLVQKVLIYYTFNKFHLNSFNLLVIPHVVNFRYVANFRFLTLIEIVLQYKIQKKLPFDNNISRTPTFPSEAATMRAVL